MPPGEWAPFFSVRFDGAPRRLRSRIESVAGAMRDAAFNKSSHCFRAILCFVIPVCSSFRVAFFILPSACIFWVARVPP